MGITIPTEQGIDIDTQSAYTVPSENPFVPITQPYDDNLILDHASGSFFDPPPADAYTQEELEAAEAAYRHREETDQSEPYYHRDTDPPIIEDGLLTEGISPNKYIPPMTEGYGDMPSYDHDYDYDYDHDQDHTYGDDHYSYGDGHTHANGHPDPYHSHGNGHAPGHTHPPNRYDGHYDGDHHYDDNHHYDGDHHYDYDHHYDGPSYDGPSYDGSTYGGSYHGGSCCDGDKDFTQHLKTDWSAAGHYESTT